MTKCFFIGLSLLFFSNSLFAESKFEISATEDNQSKACLIAMGKYRKEVKNKCAKLKKKVHWDKFNVSECIKEKISQEKYKGTFKVTYSCI